MQELDKTYDTKKTPISEECGRCGFEESLQIKEGECPYQVSRGLPVVHDYTNDALSAQSTQNLAVGIAFRRFACIFCLQ